ILSGGAASVYDKSSPKCDAGILKLGVPVLGICYGHQLIAYLERGAVRYGKEGEYGTTNLNIQKNGVLLQGLRKMEQVWMNHRDIVERLPAGYSTLASTGSSRIAAYANTRKRIYGVQFHPEVTHTTRGQRILKNFARLICRARRQYSTQDFINNAVKEARKAIGKRKAILGLSGGIDSSTAAVLMEKAIGGQLTAVYVDTGLMRHQETEFMKKTFQGHKMKFRAINAGQRFFKALRGVTSPEQKRKIIGSLFVRIFEEEARKEKAQILIQGTIYSDRIESGITKHSAIIKSHHNVGGLPKKMNLEVYEPLRDIYKDEVRKTARTLGLPDGIIGRHVFPGPGIAIRIVGEVTSEKAEIVRKASYIVEQELQKAGLYNKVWMGFAVLLSLKCVGIQGDERTYRYPIVIRIIESKDAMTANYTKMPYDILGNMSTRIVNEIKQVNRVVYDITNKPPGTMEWE
ncbi:MAG: glutamine-hydrolyzing GMP synthase, partial [Candidatus Altiarchaeota archaeon]|nr:glutamine-hydrolyzing GMP synthase [Candidatus Altiarchaeota archaeon]